MSLACQPCDLEDCLHQHTGLMAEAGVELLEPKEWPLLRQRKDGRFTHMVETSKKSAVFRMD